MIKLILSDMDGTLLDEEAKLPAEFDAMMLSNNANTTTDEEIAGLLDGN